ncbi:MAG: hypothetical protein C4547_09195 [Phycisphaerales bacterium]|nr:MAG: hypothetical protein C4547_09195 [Phycisphaerales bacterium]
MHPATLDEIEARFGMAAELRRVQMDSVRWMVDLAKRADVYRIILNGSFVTDKIEPQDVDCVLLLRPGRPENASARAELDAGLPFLDLHLVGQTDFDRYTTRIFGTDRDEVPKGMIEVVF